MQVILVPKCCQLAACLFHFRHVVQVTTKNVRGPHFPKGVPNLPWRMSPFSWGPQNFMASGGILDSYIVLSSSPCPKDSTANIDRLHPFPACCLSMYSSYVELAFHAGIMLCKTSVLEALGSAIPVVGFV